MKPFTTLIAAALLAAAPAFAANSPAAPPTATASPPAASDTMSDGEVKKVDKSAGKITLKHGPLATLEMPAMTMVFRVKDPAMLDQLKVGDRIRFAAEKVGGYLTVTEFATRQ